jgi:rRNA-processing protein FCF1
VYEGVNLKDEHVVASAISMGAHYLLTLDRPLIREIEAGDIPIIPVTPESFMVDHLPDHPEHPFSDERSHFGSGS